MPVEGGVRAAAVIPVKPIPPPIRDHYWFLFPASLDPAFGPAIGQRLATGACPVRLHADTLEQDWLVTLLHPALALGLGGLVAALPEALEARTVRLLPWIMLLEPLDTGQDRGG